MKKLVLLVAAIALSVGAYAQKYAFVNTETIFKAMPEYNQAMQKIDAMAKGYQEQIDADYAKIAEMYERYQYQKQNLSETIRKQVEDNILKLEKETADKQKGFFGPDGQLMKSRLEMLKPMQERVFQIIDTMAQQQGIDMILDISNNPSVVYYNKSRDLSNDVLKALGISK